MALFENVVLQGMVSGVENTKTMYIAGRAIPAIPTPKTGVFVTKDRLAALTADVDLRVASCSQAVQLKPREVVGTAYRTVGKAVKDVICFDNQFIDQSNTENAQELLGDLMDQLLLDRELELEEVITTSTWNAASGNVGGGNVWNGAGDPWAQIIAASQAIPGGANTVIMGEAAWASFMTNPKAIAYLSNDTFKVLQPDQAAAYMRDALGIPTLYVSHARSASGRVFADDVFVARIDGNGGNSPQGLLVRQTAIARFVASDLRDMTGGDDILVKSEGVIDVGVRSGELWRAAKDELIVQVSSKLGVLLSSVNS